MDIIYTKNKSPHKEDKDKKTNTRQSNKGELPTPIKIWKTIIEKKEIRINHS